MCHLTRYQRLQQHHRTHGRRQGGQGSLHRRGGRGGAANRRLHYTAPPVPAQTTLPPEVLGAPLNAGPTGRAEEKDSREV